MVTYGPSVLLTEQNLKILVSQMARSTKKSFQMNLDWLCLTANQRVGTNMKTSLNKTHVHIRSM